MGAVCRTGLRNEVHGIAVFILVIPRKVLLPSN